MTHLCLTPGRRRRDVAVDGGSHAAGGAVPLRAGRRVGDTHARPHQQGIQSRACVSQLAVLTLSRRWADASRRRGVRAELPSDVEPRLPQGERSRAGTRSPWQ